ncbi:hypothetical protein PSN45_002715 [Yamadazyma tenuis]|uniref:WW domain-containing protein n=1 Tax=Candida tenuis (strain ATCC 10573 / BCRC 21748 / CBS 615 / JCM 9827 / NBRC 10315 / NRRL Y-1498 / VKM Y-70) TaxID=590646 RepID=G3AX23_CANTC|nr:uncharacterized protein CANTEDRAFT_91840 [Yamadazyma tenuis ATCC 10573]EGV66670.1 hypothetical protein CANTEDRAFT_91840 [Yamadazyma tenuis ATCC 10573]WEJ95202.1 hypothetical protein PSN45_002715 [Yamadazyma tenuis]
MTKGCNWKLQFDSTLNQYYYLDTKTNTISFDCPAEVKRTKKQSLLRRLSFKSKKSNESLITATCSDALSKNSTNSTSSYTSQSSTSSTPSQPQPKQTPFFDDEYLLNNPTNFRNFAGTSLAQADGFHDDVSSIDSESVITYYSELNHDIYAEDYYSFDKEKERIELRLQFMKELSV